MTLSTAVRRGLALTALHALLGVAQAQTIASVPVPQTVPIAMGLPNGGVVLPVTAVSPVSLAPGAVGEGHRAPTRGPVVIRHLRGTRTMANR